MRTDPPLQSPTQKLDLLGTRGRRPQRTRLCAFTLVELLVVISILSILAGLLLPVLTRAKESGRAAVCLSNLHQVGIALQLYVQENNNRMPYMNDRSLTTTNPYPPPDLVLASYLGNLGVLRCPSDGSHTDFFRQYQGTCFEKTGCSYAWFSIFNGQNADHLDPLGLSTLGVTFGPHQIPLFCDKEKFHAARGENKAQNWLYADGHIKNLFEWEGSVPLKP